MRPFGRRRFADVVERQLSLFVAESADLLREGEAALGAYDRASRDEAEERYAAYLDLVESGQSRLVEIRESYARTLGEEAADEYRATFDRLVRKKLPRFGLELEG